METKKLKKAKKSTVKKICDDCTHNMQTIDTQKPTEITCENNFSVQNQQLETLETKKAKKSLFYVCNDCNYNSKAKQGYNRHLLTMKHKNTVLNNIEKEREKISYLYNEEISEFLNDFIYMYIIHIFNPTY